MSDKPVKPMRELVGMGWIIGGVAGLIFVSTLLGRLLKVDTPSVAILLPFGFLLAFVGVLPLFVPPQATPAERRRKGAAFAAFCLGIAVAYPVGVAVVSMVLEKLGS